jgi:hypothetical protein
VDGYAANILPHDFALARVQARANINPERVFFFCNRAGAANAARWTIERRKYSVDQTPNTVSASTLRPPKSPS